MFGIENYTGFIIAAVILNITPGADTFYVLTRCVAQGKKAGLVSVAGIMTGCIVHVLGAALGLSVILSTSAAVFNLVKWAGALYLIYLGTRTILERSGSRFDHPDADGDTQDLWAVYRQGIITNVLNPKVALFFLSFLPQFVDPRVAAGPLPFFVLGGTFLVTGTAWLMVITGAAAVMTRTLRNNRNIETILHKLSGVIFIGFGVKLALSSR